MQNRRHALFLIALFLGTLTVPAAPQPSSLEYEVKAAFLLNFTKFIDWPAPETPGPDSPFTICILGDDPFGPPSIRPSRVKTLTAIR